MTVNELISELLRHDPQDEVRIWDIEPGYHDPDSFYFECHDSKPIIELRRMDLCIGGRIGIVLFKEGDQE
jgi:hypothetical protein